MKIDMIQSELKQASTTIEPNKFKVEVMAVGDKTETEEFYQYIRQYKRAYQHKNKTLQSL
jgi:hypothetical protein